ncbi:MAG: TonB-dependent receptor [Gammaproteobacteria bacterium]|nr:TonB-dependent receptor [Gammaproteobacteria bacterium]
MRMSQYKLDSFRILTLTALWLANAASQAQSPLPEEGVIEEIVVTATKRSARIQDVPFSVAAKTGEEIARSGARGIEDLALGFAGMSVQNLGPGQSQVAMRGVSAGQIVRDQPGVKEQVGIYMDDSVVSLSLFTPDFDLFDLNRVEVLRGPQGTLYGAGSVGGTVRYITNRPELELDYGLVEAELNSIAGGGSGWHFKGMANLAISDSSALRLVGYTTDYGGYIDALSENGSRNDNVNSGSRTGVRLSLLWDVTDRVSILPRLIHQRAEADGFNREEVFNLFANPHTTTRPAIQLGDREQHLLLGEEFEDETTLFDFKLSASFASFDLTSVSSFLRRELLASRDASALVGSVTVSLGFPHEHVAIPSNLRDTTELDQFTQEIHLASANESRLRWLIGAFYSDLKRDYAQRLPTPGYDAVVDAALGPDISAGSMNGYPLDDSPYNSDLPYDISQIAVFGEATYALTDRFDLTLGGRWYDWEEERRFYSGGLFSNSDLQTDSTDASGFSPRLLASFRLSEQLTWNAQAARGFRPGGVNDPLNASLCTGSDLANFGGFQTYDDETIWNYETGLKSEWGSGVRLNAAVFHAQIDNLQATLDAGSCSSRISFNVEEAHASGVEVELNLTPARGLEIGFAGSLVRSEFDSTVLAEEGGVLGGVADGNRLASVPEIQFSATINYSISVDLFGGSEFSVFASVQHVGDRITQPGDQVAGAGRFVSGLAYGGATGMEVTELDLELDPYTLIAVRVGIIRDDWEAALYVNNLTDEKAALSFDRERGGRARLGFRVNQPRTVGFLIRRSL